MDRKTNAKSAPAFGRKRNEKKTTSLREIENWVNQGNSKEITSRTSARNVGLLTENVTEDIMLYSRQCELGRERYKFLVNHAYERQKFLEHQNKKEKSMKKQMLAARRSIERIIPPPESRRKSLTVRIPQVDQTESPTNDMDDGPIEDVMLSTVRTDPVTAKEVNIVLHTNAEKEIHLPKAVNLDKKKTKATYLNTGAKSPTKQMSDKDRDTGKLPSVKPAVCKGVSYGERPGSLKSAKSERTTVTRVSKTDNNVKNSGKDSKSAEKSNETLSPKKTLSVKDAPVNMWASKSPYARVRKFGEKFFSSVNDPRYVALASTLIPHTAMERQRSEVSDIIARKDALRRRSKCEGDYTKRLHARFIAQLLHNELSATM